MSPIRAMARIPQGGTHMEEVKRTGEIQFSRYYDPEIETASRDA